MNGANTAWRIGLLGAAVAVVLGGVDTLTRTKIQANEQRVMLALLATVTGDDSLANPHGDINPPLTICTASGAPLYHVFQRSVRGYAGPIQLLIGINANGALTGVRAISHRETAGIGDAIDVDKSQWLLTLEGRPLADIALVADGGSIDVITGASVTSRAVINGVHDALADAAGAPSWTCSSAVDE